MAVDPTPRKSLGQHWLTDAPSLQAMCAGAEIDADDTILEIGPGLGSLTQLLVRRAKRVVAIELDGLLAELLTARVPAKNLSVEVHDILRYDFTSLPVGYKVVANIPYYLTSNLIRVLSESSNPPSCAVLLVQREVAERIAAPPGRMSLLSVTAQWHWRVETGRVVEARLFDPPPKVDSQIIILRHKHQREPIDTKALFRVVKAGFSQRRKTLLNSMSAGMRLDKTTVLEALDASNIQPNTRAQSLSLDQWVALYNCLTR